MKKIIVGAGLLLAQLLCSKAYPYTFASDFNQGIYLPSFPLTMPRFAVDATEGAQLQAMVEKAVEEWEAAVGVDLWNVEGDFIVSTNATGNYIRWSNNFAEETGHDPTRTLAVTIRYNDGSHVQRVLIILNGQMPNLRADASGLLYKTVLHEIGHTIALDHSQEESIMQAFVGSIEHLTSDDVDGAVAVVNETLKRQGTGQRANLGAGSDKKEGQSKTLGCGTVDIVAGGGGGSGLFSFFLGLMVILFLNGQRRPVTY